MPRPFAWEASYPDHVRWDAPIAISTLPELLDRAVAQFANRPALEFRGRRMSYAELGERVDRLARGLTALGVLPGDAVALLLTNSPAHPIAFFAVMRIGGVVVHLSPLDPARAVERKLADSGAQTMIVGNLPVLLPQALAARQSGAVRTWIGGRAVSMPRCRRAHAPCATWTGRRRRGPWSSRTTPHCCSIPAGPPARRGRRC